MTSARTLRERIREELRHEIVESARSQLSTHGASSLSLRAIARDLDIASSAVYRYFPSRDDLLTTLIVDGYNAIGEAVEQADQARPRDDYLGRWISVCRALRGWATAHPHVYALVYGSPVPGYHAPEGTVEPAIRDKAVYGRIVNDAYLAGSLRTPEPARAADADALAADAQRLRTATMPAVPDEIAFAALTAWAGLFGMLNLELFGHFENVIENRDVLFDQSVHRLGRMIGLPG